MGCVLQLVLRVNNSDENVELSRKPCSLVQMCGLRVQLMVLFKTELFVHSFMVLAESSWNCQNDHKWTKTNDLRC